MARSRVRCVAVALRQCVWKLRRDESGVALLETIIVLPVILVFLVGILEFSGLLLNKLQVETGLKEAARYLARCHEDNRTAGLCSEAIARNIAVYGQPDAGTNPRAYGWKPEDIQINAPGGVTRSATSEDGEDFNVVRVSTNFSYPGSPLIGLIGFDGLTVQASHEERVIGF